ncbi:MAG: PEP-CTERM sorting domain-containing protein, partial [Verrucomicrobiota bacterium]
PFGYDASDPDFPRVSFFFESNTVGALDPSQPNESSTLSGFVENFVAPGNFMIRATGIESILAPEPSTALLLLCGSASLFGLRRRRLSSKPSSPPC